MWTGHNWRDKNKWHKHFDCACANRFKRGQSFSWAGWAFLLSCVWLCLRVPGCGPRIASASKRFCYETIKRHQDEDHSIDAARRQHLRARRERGLGAGELQGLLRDREQCAGSRDRHHLQRATALRQQKVPAWPWPSGQRRCHSSAHAPKWPTKSKPTTIQWKYVNKIVLVSLSFFFSFLHRTWLCFVNKDSQKNK